MLIGMIRCQVKIEALERFVTLVGGTLVTTREGTAAQVSSAPKPRPSSSAVPR